MHAKKLLAIGCLSLFTIFIVTTAYMGITHSLVHQYQVVESDGYRQREYKIFGVIPYEKREVAQDVRVAGDFWQAVTKSGLVVGPEVDRKREDMMIIRTIPEKSKPGYYLRTTIKGDYGKLVAFYGGQVTGASASSGKTLSLAGSVKSTGTMVSILLDLRSRGAKPGEDEIDFGVGVPMP
jgi:hypothetical protein